MTDAPMTLRADARRNAARITEVAAAAFAEHGPDASLIDIARTAGVGSATLYRRFPNRESLLAAVYQGQVDEVVRLAGQHASTSSPAEALEGWLRSVADQLTEHRGLKGLLNPVGEDGGSELFAKCQQQLFGAADTLLGAAREKRSVREDVSGKQVLLLVNAAVVAAGKDSPKPGAEEAVFLDVVLDGLRSRG